MSQLHTYLEDYVQTLQAFMTEHSDSEDLLDAAEDKWGTEDYRFMVLQERPKSQRWKTKPAAKASSEQPNPEDEPNELIDWAPKYVQELQDLLAQTGNDEDLLKAAKEKWGDTYGYLVIEAGK